jgi:hypothetical protein
VNAEDTPRTPDDAAVRFAAALAEEAPRAADDRPPRAS